MPVDIVGIKTAFKTVITAANTSTAAYDLSTSMSSRVRVICTKSPNNYMFGADMLPAVAIWSDSKTVKSGGIAMSQKTAQREGAIRFSVAGIIWNSDFDSIESDSSDNEIEKLMENIEEVLRGNDTLNGTVLHHKPLDVTYHNLSMSEQQHYKIGIMQVECLKFY